MDRYKLYTNWLIILIVVEATLILLTCMYLQPVTGDTTRLSGYSENDFGWNLPQKTFAKAAASLKEEYDQYSDVVVVGDSFSFGGVLGMMNYPWQTFLTAATGLSVITISHYTTKTNPPSYDPTLVYKIINSELFKRNPPKLFILEVVERQLNMLPKVEGDCRVHNKIKDKSDYSISNNNSKPTVDVYRPKNHPSLSKRIDFAVKFWKTKLLLNKGDNQAFLFALTSENLFSSARSDTLLVYEGDVKKKNWDAKLIENTRCKLINMQNMVQANGKTLFIAMVAPDKLTAYSPYLKDTSAAKYTVIGQLSTDSSLHLPRFDLPLQQAIKNGMIDVYLPNDTHWASIGQNIAATTIIDYLLGFQGD